MVECAACGTEEQFPFVCNYCNTPYCSEHRLPENHECPGLNVPDTTSKRFASWFGEGDRDESSSDSPAPMDTDDLPSIDDESDRTKQYRAREGGDPSPDVNPDGSIAGDQTSPYSGEPESSWRPSLSYRRKQQLKRWTKQILFLAVIAFIVGGLLIAFTPVSLGSYWDSPTAEKIDSSLKGLAAPFIETVNNTVTSDVSEVSQLIHEKINDRRAEHGLPPLEWSASLHRLALDYSQQMGAQDFYGHVSPDGETPSMRYSTAACRYAGENLNRITGASVLDEEGLASMAVESWMESPGHRRNILQNDISSEGVGVFVDDTGSETTVYFTQVFCR